MKPSQQPVPVECSACHRTWLKRMDSIKSWSGLCHSCSSKKTGTIPSVREARIRIGKTVMRRVGKLPQPIAAKRRRGSNHPNWKGGITPKNLAIRWSTLMDLWRRAVFARDGFRCVACGINDHRLQADHIKPFSLFPLLRFDVSNGRTMCKPCHKEYGAIVRRGVLLRAAILEFNGTPITREAT
jgi:hypothetical protein